MVSSNKFLFSSRETKVAKNDVKSPKKTCSRVLCSAAECCRVLCSAAECCRVLQSAAECSFVLHFKGCLKSVTKSFKSKNLNT